MNMAQAYDKAKQISKGGKTVFVAEWMDEPGRFSALSEDEYQADWDCGEFYREAVAEFFDGKFVAQS